MDVARLNIHVGGLPSKGFAGSEAVFEELARLVGERIPQSYRALMRHADGGHPEVGTCPLEAGGLLLDVDHFYALANPGLEQVKDVLASWGPLLGEGMLPIGRDGGDNQIYLALREEPASVWLYRHGNGQRLKLAKDLEAFVESLIPNPDFI